DPRAVQTITRAVKDYNAVFTPLNDHRHSYETRIQAAWTGAKAEGLTRDLGDVYRLAVDELHNPYVLGLNQDLLTPQPIREPSHPSSAEVSAAVDRVAGHARDMAPRIEALRISVDRLREHLRAD